MATVINPIVTQPQITLTVVSVCNQGEAFIRGYDKASFFLFMSRVASKLGQKETIETDDIKVFLPPFCTVAAPVASLQAEKTLLFQPSVLQRYPGATAVVVELLIPDLIATSRCFISSEEMTVFIVSRIQGLLSPFKVLLSWPTIFDCLQRLCQQSLGIECTTAHMIFLFESSMCHKALFECVITIQWML